MVIKIEKKYDDLSVVVTIDRCIIEYSAISKKTAEIVKIKLRRNDGKTLNGDGSSLYILRDEQHMDAATIKKYPMAYGRFGDSLISKKFYDQISETLQIAIADADKNQSSEYTELIALEADRQKREDERYEKLVEHQLRIENAAGYCKKCGTFCFGDCMSNI